MKNILRLIILLGLTALFALLLVPPAAHAQAPTVLGAAACPDKILACKYTEPFGLEFEGLFQFNAHVIEHMDSKTFGFLFGPSLGLFVVKGLQIGVAPIVAFSYDTDGESTTSADGGASLFVNYIFDTHSILFPYVGALMGARGGVIKPENGNDINYKILSVGPEVGMKVLVAGRAIVTLYLDYLFSSRGDELEDDWTEYHDVNLGLGIGFWI